VVGSAGSRPAASTSKPRPTEIPPDEVAKLEIQVKLEEGRILAAVHNASRWEVSELRLAVAYKGDDSEREYLLHFDGSPFAHILGDAALAPASAGRFWARIGLDPGHRELSYRLAGARGRVAEGP
jgi:hypothetical protein